ncbi:MAG TPA: hypothetical protein DEH78_17865 [Solibacterales bacterium]|nr:hypothetical protein [Bryobacterales bacterium]
MTRRNFVLAAAAATWNWDRRGARFGLAGGSGEIRFISPSSFFAIRRWADSSLGPNLPENAVNFTASEAGDAVELVTDYIRVRVDKSTFRLRVSKVNGEVLMEEAAPPKRAGEDIVLDFQLRPGEECFGLGPRADASIGTRGSRIVTRTPLLLSTAGYGMFQLGSGEYEYDLTAGHRVVARKADRAGYAFYYGPNPKDIFEEHAKVRPSSNLRRAGTALPETPGEASWDSLQETVRRMIHGSLSGIMLPRFDADRYAGTPAAARARQLAGLFPWGGETRFEAFFEAYLDEARERGIPLVHALPAQFPKDPEGLRRSDQFLLGDELLAAPVLNPAGRRAVYLPMGRWTDLRTNIEHPGRRVIEVESPDSLPLFAKNGSIVPFGRLSQGTVELHYFPNSGGEFFLFEPTTGTISQVHAAPAGDYFRVEIESHVTRKYEWVIHHRGPAKRVDGPASAVRHDARRNNLHIEMDGPAGEGRIVNVTL